LPRLKVLRFGNSHRINLAIEDSMETSKELIERYWKWTVEYVKAKEAFDKLLPPAANQSQDEHMIPLSITGQSLIEFEETVSRVETAIRKLRGILEKL
jgi:hypothetical protein